VLTERLAWLSVSRRGSAVHGSFLIRRPFCQIFPATPVKSDSYSSLGTPIHFEPLDENPKG
jgi:hypothetical protein